MANNDHAGKYAMIKYYTQSNEPKYGELLKIKERLPDIVKAAGTSEIGKILMAELTKFVKSYTVVRPMNEDQIAECSYAILSTSEEDFLSLQDLIIFFDGAKQGKYGRILDHIDQHIIFEMLEQYRQHRHITRIRIKEEQDTQFKGFGNNNRTSDERVDAESDIRDVMVDYFKKSVEENK